VQQFSKLKVRDIMSVKVRVASPTDRLDDVHRLMKLGGFRHVPVIEDGKLVGVLSDHDVYLGWPGGGQTAIGQLMTKMPRWIGPEASARDAAGILLRHRIGCLPVVDGDRGVIGIVTETDFVALAHRALLIQEALAQTPPAA
jgi:CBS domain-containing protein